MTSLAERAFQVLRHGDGDARPMFVAAIAAAPGDAALRLGDSEARFAAGEREPWAALDPLLAAHPDWVEGQNQRAALRWESGLGDAFADGFRVALSARPRDAALWNAYITALSGVGDHVGAADAARDAQARFDVPVLRLIEASHAGMAGDVARTARLLDDLPADLPGRAPVEIRHMMRLGRIDAAENLLAGLRTADPADLATWALTDLTWRILGDDRATWLAGQDGMIGASDLGLDTADLALLADSLRALHRQRSQPIGQSVRGGTQTRGALFDRRDPTVRNLLEAIQRGVRSYLAELPQKDATHPLLRHGDRSIVARGGWSVRLMGAGFHVPHIHPAGILSSACHIVVPKLDPGTQAGWLELGAPPPDLRVDLAPRVTIEPRPGRLVLFPSYLYHGTRPFDEGERLTVAFDAS